jgi:hypothetical protein
MATIAPVNIRSLLLPKTVLREFPMAGFQPRGRAADGAAPPKDALPAHLRHAAVTVEEAPGEVRLSIVLDEDEAVSAN